LTPQGLKVNDKRTSALFGYMTILFLSFTLSHAQINPYFYQNIDINQSREFQARVTALLYNQQNALMAVGYESGQVDIFDAISASRYMRMRPTTTRADMLSFSDDGQYLAVSSYFDAATYIYDVSAKKLTATLQASRGPEVFTPDNHFIVLADTDSVKLYNWQERQQSASYQTHGVVHALSVDNEGKYVAVGTALGGVELFAINHTSWWDRIVDRESKPNLSRLRTVEAHDEGDWILKLWFIENRLVTLSRFGHLDLWSLPDLKPKATLALQLKFVNDAVLGANQQIIALGVTHKNGVHGNRLAERIDLKSMKSEVITELRSNLANASLWPRDKTTEAGELIFVEHGGTKLLLRLEDATHEYDTLFAPYLKTYMEIPFYYKAFAAAQDRYGRYETYYIWGDQNQSEANRKALERCQANIQITRLEAECKILFEGDYKIAP
jgi:WD40 repeat protein